MSNVTYVVSVDEVRKRLGLLSDRANAVIARAANRSYKTGKKTMAQETAKKYAVTQKDVNKPLKVKRATYNNPMVEMQYTGEHRNLYLWNNNKAVTPNTIISWKGGVPNVKIYKAKVMRRGTRHKLTGMSGQNNKPFIQHVRKGQKSDFVGLFQRASSKRDAKLVSVQAPAIPQILKNKDTLAKFQRATAPMLQKRLEHEINAVLRGYAK